MSKYPFLNGVITPAFTASNDDGSLDPEGMAEYIKWIAKTGAVASVFVRCGVGKMYTFDYDEVEAIIDAAASVRDRVPIIVGVCGIWNRDRGKKADLETYTSQSIELGKYAFKRGASAVVAVIPDGLPVPPGEDAMPAVIEYYRTLDRELGGPIVLYHTPGLEERFALTPDALTEIARLPHIAGMKYSVGDLDKFENFAKTALGANPDFVVVCGVEYILYQALEFGARGVIGGGGNYWPEIMQASIDAYLSGNKQLSEEIQQALLELIMFKDRIKISDDALFSYGWAKQDGYKVQVNVRRGRPGFGEGDPYKSRYQTPTPIPEADFNAVRNRIREVTAGYWKKTQR